MKALSVGPSLFSDERTWPGVCNEAVKTWEDAERGDLLEALATLPGGPVTGLIQAISTYGSVLRALLSRRESGAGPEDLIRIRVVGEHVSDRGVATAWSRKVVDTEFARRLHLNVEASSVIIDALEELRTCPGTTNLGGD